MAGEGDSPSEIRENFERFLEGIVEKQGNEPVSRDFHPFEQMRAVMVAVTDELMPCLRPMHEFDAIVARAGGEDGLKMALVNAFHGALCRGLCVTWRGRVPTEMTTLRRENDGRGTTMSRREPGTPDWQPFSIRRLLRMVGGLVFVDETHELGEADDGEPIIARAERRLDKMLAARREMQPADYVPIDDDGSLISDIAVIMIRYKELAQLQEKLVCAFGPPCTVRRLNKKTGKMEDKGLADDYGDD
jgi:hypothetical protein